MDLRAVKESVRESVRKCLRNGEAGSVDEATPLLANGALDSLALVELVMDLADRFHIEFGDDDLNPENFATLGDLVRMIERKRTTA